jgi:transcription antitermination factor NusG
MDQMTEHEQWYALQLRPRFEKVVASHLRAKGYEEYLPLHRSRRRWSDRVKEIELPLFPGYIFCRFDIRSRLPILIVPGVMSVVSFGGISFAVPEDEINAVRNVVNSGLPYGPWPFMSAGHRVHVERGPLRGLDGVVVEARDDYRLVISVTMLQRSVSVSIERDCVSPIRTSMARAAVVA